MNEIFPVTINGIHWSTSWDYAHEQKCRVHHVMNEMDEFGNRLLTLESKHEKNHNDITNLAF